MKTKTIVFVLLLIGFALICLSIALAASETASKDIIGGADIHTFLFVFLRENKGVYSLLTVLGIASVVSSIIVGVMRKKK